MLIAAAALASAVSAQAQRAEICYGAEQPPGSPPPANDSVFSCPTLGQRTVPQIAQAGWRIVKLAPVTGGNGIRNQLLIRLDDRLFGNGFE